MKKNKGLFIGLCVVTMIGVGCTPTGEKESNIATDHEVSSAVESNASSQEAVEKRDEYVPAKAEGFQSLEEMERASECIVRVKKESEDEPVDPSKSNATGHTMAQVRIQEVFHNTLGDAVQQGQVIDIWENEFPDGDVICHLEGYEKMKIGEEYILFLRKSTTDDCFLSLGITFGKVPVIEEEESEFIKKNASSINPIIKTIAAEARAKYVK